MGKKSRTLRTTQTAASKPPGKNGNGQKVAPAKPAIPLISPETRAKMSAAPKPATPAAQPTLPAPVAPANGFRPAKFALNSTITVVATANPKRPGTKAHSKWPLYGGCKTVADVIAAFLKAGWKKRNALSALRWDSGHGFIEINESAASKVTQAAKK
jgi:hypothetical protein